VKALAVMLGRIIEMVAPACWNGCSRLSLLG
jgi:hypothetical protein